MGKSRYEIYGRSEGNYFNKSESQRWNVTHYPNPMMGEHRLCRMSESTTVCDPDEILDEEERQERGNKQGLKL